MHKKVCIATVIAALFIAGCINQKPTDPIQEKISMQLDSLMLNAKIPALSVGIIDGENVYILHKGKLLDGREPSRSTLYEIASLTKTFTGTLLAFAIVEKRVRIDDDIRLYLQDSFPNLVYEGHPITFRHLVTHQSGLPNMFPNVPDLFAEPNWDELPSRINELQQGFSKEDFFKALSKTRLDTLPGAGFNYSNAGANLLGYLLEEIYATSFDDLLKNKILTPLGMKNTYIGKANLPTEQPAQGQNANRVPMPFRVEKEMNAEGGIFSTIDDMLKYMKYHLNEENTVVATSHMPLWEGKFGDFEAGLFWQINKDGKNPVRIFQNGGSYGTSSWITLIPEKDIGVFIITNIAGQGIHQGLSETADKIIDELYQNKL